MKEFWPHSSKIPVNAAKGIYSKHSFHVFCLRMFESKLSLVTSFFCIRALKKSLFEMRTTTKGDCSLPSYYFSILRLHKQVKMRLKHKNLENDYIMSSFVVVSSYYAIGTFIRVPPQKSMVTEDFYFPATEGTLSIFLLSRVKKIADMTGD